MKNWYRFESKAEDPTVAEIHIIDYIGSWDDDWFAKNFGLDMGVTARAFVEELSTLPAAVTTIHVHINSPGGDVFAGVNIANALRDQQVSKGRTVETYVDGLAGSIASVIAMAGSKVVIADNALMMIHDPFTGAFGNARELRKVADILDTLTTQIVNSYRWHSTLDAEALMALMREDTWLSADEAIAKGLATDKIEGLRAAASISPQSVATMVIPAPFKARVEALLAKPEPKAPEPVAASAMEVVRVCNAAGCPEEIEGLLGATIAQVQAKTSSVQAAKAAEQTRRQSITDICALAKQPELAAGYISGQMSVDAVKAHLAVITAKQDRVEIDAGLTPDASAGAPRRAIDTVAIYDRFNQRKLAR